MFLLKVFLEWNAFLAAVMETGEFWYSENDNERFKSELSAPGHCWRLQRGARGPDGADWGNIAQVQNNYAGN